MRIFSGFLIAVTFFLSLSHGWQSIRSTPAEIHAQLGLEFSKPTLVVLGVITLLSAVLLLFPRTFLLSNILSGFGLFYLTALQANNRNVRGALVELPFLMLPLVLLYLGHPFKR